MKTHISLRVAAATALILTLAGCKDTWLMYDTSQKDHLYFEVTSALPQVSFSLIEDQQIEYNVAVKMMGMPVDYDRTFSIEYIDADPDETITVGTEKIPVITAQSGTDFEIGALTLPAGAVETSIPLTLHRQEVMKTKYACIRFRIVEDDEFLPLAADSTFVKKIKTPLFNLYVNDGDPTCPDWWDASATGYDLFGWTLYLGRFYPEKFRKMLDLYHQVETKNPVFYQECVDRYGENLDKEGIAKNFIQLENPTVWASYVLIPLCEYYKTYYAEHPDDPNYEEIKSSGSSGTDWTDPIALLR